jgi:nucleoside-diphosphate-sugar epimerase
MIRLGAKSLTPCPLPTTKRAFEARPGDYKGKVASFAKARKELGWEPGLTWKKALPDISSGIERAPRGDKLLSFRAETLTEAEKK